MVAKGDLFCRQERKKEKKRYSLRYILQVYTAGQRMTEKTTRETTLSREVEVDSSSLKGSPRVNLLGKKTDFESICVLKYTLLSSFTLE